MLLLFLTEDQQADDYSTDIYDLRMFATKENAVNGKGKTYDDNYWKR